MNSCDHKFICLGTHWLSKPDKEGERIDTFMCVMCYDQMSKHIKYSKEKNEWITIKEWTLDDVVEKEDKEEWDCTENGLLLCPFCGTVPNETADNEMEITIECGNCGASVYCHNGDGDDYVARCRKKWNNRVE